jgi:DNA-directed RNA polymerase specialized sigma24 family protein
MTETNRAAIRRLLWRWGRVQEFCKSKERELEFYADKLESSRDLSGRTMDGMPRGGETSDPTARAALSMEGIIDCYAELVDKIRGAIYQELEFKKAMDEVIDELPHEQRRIIELRYLDGHQWVFIAMKMCMDDSTARRMEVNAVDSLSPKIDICAEISV